jgi:hypothetical protein
MSKSLSNERIKQWAVDVFNYHTIRATMAPGHIRHVIVKLISNALREINLLKLRSHNSRYYLIVLVTKASITVHLQPIV